MAAQISPLVNNESIVLENENIRIPGNNRDTQLKVFKMSNYIFRGDTHTNPVLSDDPKFYGTLTSAFNYAKPYLKIYQPTKELKLLSLNFTAANVVRIANMFKDLIGFYKYHNEPGHVKVLQILYIFLQINFGLIVPPEGHLSPYFCALNKMGFTSEEIRDEITLYSGHKTCGDFVYLLLHACDTNQNIRLDSGEEVNPRQLIGSRVSIRPMDQWIVSQLKIYLPYFFGIDGIVFDDSSMVQDVPFVCKFATKYYKAETCVPTEVVIFSPSTSLTLLDILTKNLYNQVNRSANDGINQMLGLLGVNLIGGNQGKYEKLYYKYKNKYLNLKNSLKQKN